MTGVTDLAFREVAAGLGAAYLATEMVACAQFAEGRPDAVRRAAVGEGLPLMVVQLVGRDPALVAAAARLARQAGAQIIDLNFGCPAKEVTGHLSGSAMMRDPGLAREIVAAAVDAAFADAEKRCADTVSAVVSSPRPRTFTKSFWPPREASR